MHESVSLSPYCIYIYIVCAQVCFSLSLLYTYIYVVYARVCVSFSLLYTYILYMHVYVSLSLSLSLSLSSLSLTIGIGTYGFPNKKTFEELRIAKNRGQEDFVRCVCGLGAGCMDVSRTLSKLRKQLKSV